MNILYKFPSRSRVVKFFSVLDNIKNLSKSNDYRIMATLDYDDDSMTDPKIVRRVAQDYPHVFINWGTSTGKIHAVNRGMELSGDWDILVVVSDDFIFLKDGFDLQIIKDMEENFPDTDGVLHYHDSTPKGAVQMSMSIIGRKYFNRTGNIYFPGYESLYCDTEEILRARDLGKLFYSDERLFKHNHHLFRMAPPDQLNLKNDSPEMYEKDKIVFLRRNPFLLINYATRGRPELFFETLENIKNTITTKYYKILVKIDTDDASMNTQEVNTRLSTYQNVVVLRCHPVSKVYAINFGIEWAGEWSWLVNLSDDMRFLKKNWDEDMLQDIKSSFGETTDFFAHFPDGFANEKLPTMSIIGYEYYKRDNYVYHPSYSSISCDAEAYFCSIMRGRHKYINKFYFNHIHPSNLNFPSDATYRGNDKFGYMDTENYFQRRARLFDEKEYVTLPFDPTKRD